MLFTVEILLIVLAVHNSFTENVDYCDPKMCPYQGRHVACGKTRTFSQECTGRPKLIPLEPEAKEKILDEHNAYRQLVASGQVQCFPSAVRMPMVKWCDDLAYTAEFNVRSCVFAHDACRSTSEFPMAGQNIYMAKTYRTNITHIEFMEEAMYMWFEEQLHADPDLMRSFHKTTPQTGHFTLLVNDRQTCVGCALLDAIIQDSPERHLIIFTCNYSSTNIREMASYKFGPPASECKKTNNKYSALCEDDDIDPNDLSRY